MRRPIAMNFLIMPPVRFEGPLLLCTAAPFLSAGRPRSALAQNVRLEIQKHPCSAPAPGGVRPPRRVERPMQILGEQYQQAVEIAANDDAAERVAWGVKDGRSNLWAATRAPVAAF